MKRLWVGLSLAEITLLLVNIALEVLRRLRP